MHPETVTVLAGQTRFARLVCMLLSHCLNVGSGVSMAVRCILSALAFLWRWDQLITQNKQTGGGGGDKRVKRGRGCARWWGAGFQVCVALTLNTS